MPPISAPRFPRSVQWVLIMGDAAAFLLFAGLGRDQHHESGGPFSVVITAAPFLAAWFAVAPLIGVFNRDWPLRAKGSVSAVGLAWLCAWPIGLLLRGAVQGRAVPLSFDLVALVVNSIFLIGWRSVYLAAVRRARPARGAHVRT